MKMTAYASVLLTVLMCGCATLGHAGDATTEEEKILLIQIASELEYIQQLAAKAQNASSPNARVKFDYATFIADLREQQSSTLRHAEKPNRSPRGVNPLTKRYER